MSHVLSKGQPDPRMSLPFTKFVERVSLESKPNVGIINPSRFLLGKTRPDVTLTTAQKLALKRYKSMFPQAEVVDVNQNPCQRPRWGSSSLPTLTTNSTKLVHLKSGKIFSQSPSVLHLESTPMY